MTGGTVLLSGAAPFELRLIDLASISPIPPDPVSPEEQVRAQRFRFAHHRHRYLAGRATLRQLLEKWSGIPAHRQCFGECGNGKPVLLARPDIHFSLSYADGAVLIGVGRQAPLGVDIERLRPFPEADALARDWFDDAERHALRAAPPGMARSTLFLRGWTRKEACLKATGIGLSRDLDMIATGLDTGQRRVTMAGGLQLEVQSLQTGAYLASWAHVL